ncbi:regulatory protein RecX [Arthrobacter roseus]|uniref:regulatory protein RecX n=1 Tax=Arthrobacter roseus TaxID=136274 RepID=UPI0019629DCB|nr:regulatory protein RecX [Arthrobacter roseus]MBM7848240.1 regulatory protein [Arthrobacter roseus]
MTAFDSGTGRTASSGQQDGRVGDAGSTPEQRALSVLLRQLSTAPKTRWQLEQKLADHDTPQDIAASLIDRFEELGLINDATFASMWVESRSRTKSLSRGALKRELATKGVPADCAEAALAQLTEEEEIESARRLVRRKIPSNFSSQDHGGRDKAVRRLIGMLGRKGYGAGLAFKIVADECEAVAETPEDVWFG